MVNVIKGIAIVSLLVTITGCSFYDVKERVSNGWKIVTSPNTYSYTLNDDGSFTTYIKLTGDK